MSRALKVVRPLLTTALRLELVFAALMVGAAWSEGFVFSRGPQQVDIAAMSTTVGDLSTLHAEVLVHGREVRGDARLHDGDDIKAGPGARARVRLDDGTVLIVDGETELTLKKDRVVLTRGRIFVQGGSSATTEVAVRDSVTRVVTAAAAFEATDKVTKVYCARGELVATIGGKSANVQSGETATLVGPEPKVAPETAFDDWTSGLAVPWAGERAPASAIAELWGGAADTEPGSALVVRSAKVDVTIDGEVAVTRVRTSYFNGSDRDLTTDVRMALPEGAIVTKVARVNEGSNDERNAVLAAGSRSAGAVSDRLEWAGGGWLRGTLTTVRAGLSVDLLVDYVEWLPQKDGHATYRFPMASDVESPMVGGLDVRVSSLSPAKWLSASTGAKVSGGAIELRRADVRPTGDLVVELEPAVVKAGRARAYVAAGDKNEDPYVLVRTELPDSPEAGVTLALVVDASSSVGPALLETERAAVDALLDALGPKDAVVVLAADQAVNVMGPDKATSVTPELRALVRKKLSDVHPGGASNLGLALERAADLLDAEGERAGGGMVVYLGDGRPTVGEVTARDLRRRLARRATGVPRLGALAIGQGADRWMLAELVAGAGPVLDVLDRPDAARASSSLVASALAPTFRDVSVGLGETVDRLYPRDPQAKLAGSTLTVAGRLRGALPKEVALRYRRGTKLVEEVRPLEVVRVPELADVPRRWAAQRIEENVTRADGIEPSIALAVNAKLLTPWTSWFFDGGAASAPWDARMLGLSAASDSAFASAVEPAPPPPSLLLEPPPTFDGEATIEQAAEIAARRALRDAMGPMVACRDARASIKPGLSDQFQVELSVDRDGHATNVVVRTNDTVLDRCIRVVVAAVPFYGAGVTVKVSTSLTLPPGRGSQRTTCSVASTLPLAVRRGIWRARKAKGTLDYAGAARACEVPTWADRRTLLGIYAANLTPQQGVSLVSELTAAGATDAAQFVRQELLRSLNPALLSRADLRRLLIEDEPLVDRALDKAYRAAKTDEERLATLRRYLRLAPHSPLGRRLEIALLEAKKDRPALLEAIEHIRYDAYADAGLLAECASTLRRIGLDEEGRRAFGELVERAPRDPWTLGYVGDRLRAEGLHEDALAAYLRLDAAMPDDPAVTLRVALAHAGAGRLDVATRLLDKVAQTGGRGDDGRLGELASIVSASLLTNARQSQKNATSGPAAELDALLVRRLAQTPLPDVASLVLVRSAVNDTKVEVLIARQEKDKDELPADLDASAMGLAAVRIERGGGVARIRLRHAAGFASGRPTHATVSALVLDGNDRSRARLVTREVDIAPGEKGTELRWTGEVFQ